MSENKGGWRESLNAAKQRVDEFAATEPTAKRVLDSARSGAGAASRTLDSTRKKVTQEEAFADVLNLLEEVVDVLIVQSKVIDGLTDRVVALEARQL
ncbi:hypothetical protein GEV27_07555 [Aeromicrobium sp. S22]|uniref:hypothetical protein n=1 Tax=Aeromicrobium sp. S22 TaxID=2662029 RepID=UPI00129EB9EB|nr:hypothetical protein [Aeromicrobium sp. S22]MRK01378.1 hypothetical protein [Aeromicrobium sp. S22]